MKKRNTSNIYPNIDNITTTGRLAPVLPMQNVKEEDSQPKIKGRGMNPNSWAKKRLPKNANKLPIINPPDDDDFMNYGGWGE